MTDLEEPVSFCEARMACLKRRYIVQLATFLNPNQKTQCLKTPLERFKNSPIHIPRPDSTNDIVLCVPAIEDMRVFVEVESLRTWLFCSSVKPGLDFEEEIVVLDGERVDTYDSR
jgi:hypothetical protein